MNAGFRNPVSRGTGFLALLTFVVLVLGMFGSPVSVAAQDDMPKLGIQPANSDEIFFTETIKPGDSKILTVELSNAGKSDITILTYAANVYSLVNGGLGVELSDAEASGTTNWLDYPRQTIRLPHGEGRQIEFTLTVPAETPPGEYVTSLVIQNAEAVKGTGAVTFDQILRQAIAVSIRVPGDEAPALEIGPVSYHDGALIDSLLIEVRNTGNIHLKPAGPIHVVDARGVPVLDVAVGMDSIYAGTSTLLEIGLTKAFAPGAYEVSVQLGDLDRGGSASIVDLPITVSGTSDAAGLVRIDSLDVDLVRPSDDAPVQFANVAIAIANGGIQIPAATIVLHVERDGVLVEDYPMTAESPIDTGALEMQQRYLPLSGWRPGAYTFSVRIEVTDPATGNIEILASSDEPVVTDVT